MDFWNLWGLDMCDDGSCFGEVSSWKLLISFVGDFPWTNKELATLLTELKSPWILLPRNQASLPGNSLPELERLCGPLCMHWAMLESTVLRDVLTLGLGPAPKGRCQWLQPWGPWASHLKGLCKEQIFWSWRQGLGFKWWFWTSARAGTGNICVQNSFDEGVWIIVNQWPWCWYAG